MALPMITSPGVDLIKWIGLASLLALLALSVYVADNVGALYWRFLLLVALTLAAVAMGVRAYLRPPRCLVCDREVPGDARQCPHCAGVSG